MKQSKRENESTLTMRTSGRRRGKEEEENRRKRRRKMGVEVVRIEKN